MWTGDYYPRRDPGVTRPSPYCQFSGCEKPWSTEGSIRGTPLRLCTVHGIGVQKWIIDQGGTSKERPHG